MSMKDANAGCVKGRYILLQSTDSAGGVEHAGAADAAVGGADQVAVVEGDHEVDGAGGGGQLACELARLFRFVIPAEAELGVHGAFALLIGH